MRCGTLGYPLGGTWTISRSEPTEEALIAAIDDPSLSGAVLLISPEVAASSIVRRVEALRIFRRHAARDGFWIVPVLIGLDYGRSRRCAGLARRLPGPRGTGTCTESRVGRSLRRTPRPSRAARSRPGSKPFEAGKGKARCRSVSSRVGPSAAPFSLKHDFSAQFNGRKVVEGGYSDFERGLGRRRERSPCDVSKPIPGGRRGWPRSRWESWWERSTRQGPGSSSPGPSSSRGGIGNAGPSTCRPGSCRCWRA